MAETAHQEASIPDPLRTTDSPGTSDSLGTTGTPTAPEAPRAPAAPGGPEAPEATAFTLDRLTRDVAEILYIDAEDVSPEESLIEQGLDSIRLMTLVENWRADGARISFVDLAERPTLNEWAELLATGA
ncbi:phosphopantetheine-binding protein [Streptomyces sp. NPDC020965]|uniref:phosphopantetheine-binding protein n=1 Tax=Streptomyces sp. NPDC020965 TaxID=3365105 RepID=UPI003794BA9A